jgi:hypothetical protein
VLVDAGREVVDDPRGVLDEHPVPTSVSAANTPTRRRTVIIG